MSSDVTTPKLPDSTPPVVVARRYEYLTPLWITFCFIAVLLAISMSGAGAQHRMARAGRPALYMVTVGWEWLMVGILFFAVKKSGRTIREVIGGRWNTMEDFLLDVAIAAGFWILSALILVAAAYLAGMTSPQKVDAAKNATSFLMPQSTLELILWPIVTCTAGFCEEVIFRGYLLKQFAAWTQNAWGGMIASSLIFGLSHGYQGPRLMFVITVYGMLFALLAHFRKSTRPGMMAHAWQDSFSGFMRHFLRM